MIGCLNWKLDMKEGDRVMIRGKSRVIAEINRTATAINYGYTYFAVKLNDSTYAIGSKGSICHEEPQEGFSGESNARLQVALEHSLVAPEFEIRGRDRVYVHGRDEFGKFNAPVGDSHEFNQNYSGHLGVVLELDSAIPEYAKEISKGLHHNSINWEGDFLPHIALFRSQLANVPYMGMTWRLRKIAQLCSGSWLKLSKCGVYQKKYFLWYVDKGRKILERPKSVAMEFVDLFYPRFRMSGECPPKIFHPYIIVAYDPMGAFDNAEKQVDKESLVTAVHFVQIGDYGMIKQIIHTESVPSEPVQRDWSWQRY